MLIERYKGKLAQSEILYKLITDLMTISTLCINNILNH